MKKKLRKTNGVELKKPEFGKDVTVLRDLKEEDFHPKYVQLSPRQLAEQLQVPYEFVSEFLRESHVHEASHGERAAKMGLMAEELAALSAAGLLAMRYNVKAKSCGRYFSEILAELFEAKSPLRTILSVLPSNKATEIHLSSGAGNFQDDEGEAKKHVRHYDLTLLKRRMDMALLEEPLVLPCAASCEVTS